MATLKQRRRNAGRRGHTKLTPVKKQARQRAQFDKKVRKQDDLTPPDEPPNDEIFMRI